MNNRERLQRLNREIKELKAKSKRQLEICRVSNFKDREEELYWSELLKTIEQKKQQRSKLRFAMSKQTQTGMIENHRQRCRPSLTIWHWLFSLYDEFDTENCEMLRQDYTLLRRSQKSKDARGLLSNDEARDFWEIYEHYQSNLPKQMRVN